MLWGFKKRNDGCSRKHMGQMGEEEATERVTVRTRRGAVVMRPTPGRGEGG